MPFYFFVWDEENTEHLEEHDVSPEDFEAIVSDPEQEDTSRKFRSADGVRIYSRWSFRGLRF